MSYCTKFSSYTTVAIMSLLVLQRFFSSVHTEQIERKKHSLFLLHPYAKNKHLVLIVYKEEGNGLVVNNIC